MPAPAGDINGRHPPAITSHRVRSKVDQSQARIQMTRAHSEMKRGLPPAVGRGERRTIPGEGVQHLGPPHGRRTMHGHVTSMIREL